eukprot:gene11945-8220_t
MEIFTLTLLISLFFCNISLGTTYVNGPFLSLSLSISIDPSFFSLFLRQLHFPSLIPSCLYPYRCTTILRKLKRNKQQQTVRTNMPTLYGPRAIGRSLLLRRVVLPNVFVQNRMVAHQSHTRRVQSSSHSSSPFSSDVTPEDEGPTATCTQGVSSSPYVVGIELLRAAQALPPALVETKTSNVCLYMSVLLIFSTIGLMLQWFFNAFVDLANGVSPCAGEKEAFPHRCFRGNKEGKGRKQRNAAVLPEPKIQTNSNISHNKVEIVGLTETRPPFAFVLLTST